MTKETNSQYQMLQAVLDMPLEFSLIIIAILVLLFVSSLVALWLDDGLKDMQIIGLIFLVLVLIPMLVVLWGIA